MWPFSFNSWKVSVERALAQHEARIERLRDDHEDLKVKHASLRGRVYAAGIHKLPVAEDESDPKNAAQPMTRDELRKQMGFIPGRPMKHDKE